MWGLLTTLKHIPPALSPKDPLAFAFSFYLFFKKFSPVNTGILKCHFFFFLQLYSLACGLGLEVQYL